jgi:hypothetical protein
VEAVDVVEAVVVQAGDSNYTSVCGWVIKGFCKNKRLAFGRNKSS